VPLLSGRARSSGEGGVGGSDRGVHLDNIGRGIFAYDVARVRRIDVGTGHGGGRAFGRKAGLRELLGRTEIWAKAVIQLEARSAWQGAPCRSRLNSPHFISRPFPRTGGDVRQPARPPSAGR
jgi:hypothetical protein